GANNDINVLDNSPLFDDLSDDLAPAVPYVVNGVEYRNGYYLADGIYPEWASFVKSFTVATDPKHTYFKQRQESARKDVERAFGVLQGRWGLIQQPARAYEVNTLRRIMYAGIIMHNMILEDQNMSIVDLNHVYSNPASAKYEDMFAEFFGTIGLVKKDKRTGRPKIWIYQDKVTNEPKGDATVTYEDPHAAQAAVEWFNNKEFHGTMIEVLMAESKNSHNVIAPLVEPNLVADIVPDESGGMGRGRGDASGKAPPKAWQQDGDWMCPNTSCTNVNFAFRGVCNRCGSARPAGASGGGGGRGRGRGGPDSGGGRGAAGGPTAAVPDSVVYTPASKDGDTSTDPMDASDSAVNLPQSEGSMNASLSSTSSQPHVSGQLARPTFLRGMPPPSYVAIPREASSNAANFSYNGHQQLLQNDHSLPSKATGHLPQGPSGPSASHVPHSGSHHGHLTSDATPTTSNFSSPPFWTPAAPHFQPAPGAPRIPVTSGPPGRAPVPSPLNTVQTNSSPQQPFYDTYASNPPMMAPPQGAWLQPAPAGGLPRPPFLPYAHAIPGSFPMPTQHMPLSSVPPSDAQPPGNSYGVPGVASISPVVSNSMPPIGSGMLHELPPGTDNSKNVSAVGQSTYQKPAGFNGEPDKGYSQPTPISWEKCAGTDWSLVTTNDGKRYYYNAKTKLSSWQIPTGVSELKKKQEIDALKEELTSVPNAITLPEKGSAPISFNAPAINTCGCDAISPAVSGVPVSSSALDLIKKKLQDSTTPVTSSHTAPTGPVSSELNGSAPVDQAGKGSHSENGKDKVKDENADGNLSNSSSDSEDVDSGPTNEDRAAQFKEMLKDRGVAPFSKWEKELPKFVFDPRFKAIPSYSAHRALFDHFVRKRAEEERKEKRAAHKAAIEGYNSYWMRRMRGTFSYAKASVLVNGSPSNEFLFHGGLKQGDPLSPYLFILVMESLNLSVCKAVDEGLFQGIRLHSSLALSHLFYADDALFIGEWSDSNLRGIINILKCFYLVSGLQINILKSQVLGVGVSRSIVEAAAASIGCSVMQNQFRYLGVMAKTLSIGGRLTLLKSVLGASPLYTMSIFKVPRGVLKEMESIRNSFFLGADPSDKKITWAAWDKVLASKKKGGLGVSSFYSLNRALLLKWVWRDIRNYIDDMILPAYHEPTRWVKCVPIKINIFAWRARRDCLPTMVNLIRRGVTLESVLTVRFACLARKMRTIFSFGVICCGFPPFGFLPRLSVCSKEFFTLLGGPFGYCGTALSLMINLLLVRPSLMISCLYLFIGALIDVITCFLGKLGLKTLI
nr:hypothetical protein [Tanacetum cinerariifolium]